MSNTTVFKSFFFVLVAMLVIICFGKQDVALSENEELKLVRNIFNSFSENNFNLNQLTDYLDSLKTVTDKGFSNPINHLSKLLTIRYDSTLDINEKFYQLDKQLVHFNQHRKWSIFVLYNINMYFYDIYRTKDKHLAAKHLKLAISSLTKYPTDFKSEIASAYEKMGSFMSLQMGDIDKSRRATLEAIQLHQELGNFKNVQKQYYNLSIRSFYMEEYALADKYNLQAIEVYERHMPTSIDFAWKTIFSFQINLAQKKGEKDKVKNVFLELDNLNENQIIKKETYDYFILNNLRYLLYVGMDDEFYNHLQRLDKSIENICEKRYERISLNDAKLLVEGISANQVRKIREEQIALCLCKNEEHSYYFKNLMSNLDELIVLEQKLHNYKALSKWQNLKIKHTYVKEEKIKAYAEQVNYWSNRDMEHAKNEIILQKEKNEIVQSRYYIVLFFTILLVFTLLILWRMVLLNRNKNDKLHQQKKQIERSNNNLTIKNQSLNDLLQQVNEKSNVIANQNEQMNILIKELKESNSNLENFAQMAAHDLKAPLRTINGFAKILYKRYAILIKEKDKELFSFILQSVEDLQAIIDGLLDFSLIQSKREELDFEESVHVHRVVQNVEYLLYKDINRKKAKIEILTELPIVLGRNSLVKQLFINMLNNAIKFSQEGVVPLIEISSSNYNKEMVLFAIKDNGIGIDKNDYDDIFRLFRKLHSKNDYKGSGIGLATCRKIVNKLGGEIWLESQKGKGTTFFFTMYKADVCVQTDYKIKKLNSREISKKSA